MTLDKEVTPGDHRDTQKLMRYWKHGAGAARIAWGQPGDFNRCTAELGKYVTDPEGLCAKLHHEVLGIWPATHAKELRAKR